MISLRSVGKKESRLPDLNRAPADFSDCIGRGQLPTTVSRSSQTELSRVIEGNKYAVYIVFGGRGFQSSGPDSNAFMQ